MIAHRVKTGWLHRQYRGVFSVGTPATTPHERAMAAVLACGPTGLLSDHAALALWGFARHWPAALEVTITAGDRRPSGLVVHHRRLNADERRDHYGIPVTSPARALLDCAPSLRKLTRTLRTALHSPYLTDAQLAEALARNPLHPGTKLIRFVLEGPDTDSDLEDMLGAFCHAYGLPMPVFRATVNGHRVDAYIVEAGIVIECDGWEFHRYRWSFESDRDRDADHVAAGDIPYRLTKQRLLSNPDREADRLWAIVERRTHLRRARAD